MSNEKNQLRELRRSGYEMVEGEPDIRGWDVLIDQGGTIGKVEELLFDEHSRRVRYLIVDVDDKNSGVNENRKVLVPIGLASLHEKNDDVMLDNVTMQQLRELPDYRTGDLTAGSESKVRNVLGGMGAAAVITGAAEEHSEDFYAHDHFNEDNLYRNRKQADTQTIPIIEENLNVGKRIVASGGVKVTTNIVEQPVEETINLKNEYVTVERKAVDIPIADAGSSVFQGRTVELSEKAEVPVVAKEVRVVEEVSVGKTVEERQETIHDTVRSTAVDIEHLNRDEKTGNNG
jgi:uncharacterized protein (TIGR02271 family)